MTPIRLALVGKPVSGSKSPGIHKTLLDMAGIDGDYEARDVDEDGVRLAIDELRSGRLAGINVTMPYKMLAASLCDVVEGLTGPVSNGQSQSVNTLRLQDEKIIGSSTDKTAASELLDSERFGRFSSVLVLGSGGSARAVLEAAQGRHIYVAGRNKSSLGEIGSRFGVETLKWGTAVAGALVINATPVGMNGEALPADVLSAAGGLIDLPYTDRETPAVAVARAQRIEFADGHEFLLRQALHSFQLWTGVDLEFSSVRSRL